MKTMTSGEVQTRFGTVADLVKSGEQITITQHGRPTLMMFSYQDGTAALEFLAQQRLARVFDKRAQTMPKEAEELSLDEINDLVHELRP